MTETSTQPVYRGTIVDEMKSSQGFVSSLFNVHFTNPHTPSRQQTLVHQACSGQHVQLDVDVTYLLTLVDAVGRRKTKAVAYLINHILVFLTVWRSFLFQPAARTISDTSSRSSSSGASRIEHPF